MIKKTSPPRRYSPFRNKANRIIREALNSVNPMKLVLNQLQVCENQLIIMGNQFDLNRFRSIHVIGAGKGVDGLYRGLKKKLGGRIAGGIIVTTADHSCQDRNIQCLPGDHPVPGKNSFRAGQQVTKYLASRIQPDDLVMVLITGGASSMMCLPWSGLKPADIIQINKRLLAVGADIHEINCIRKHVSALKGGRLAEKVHPARIITLILSDINESPFEDIGSGPSIGDSTTFQDTRHILEKYGLFKTLNPRLQNHFKQGWMNQIPDTPVPQSRSFRDNRHFLLGDNLVFLETASRAAQAMGIKTTLLTTRDHGEASQAACVYGSILKEIMSRGRPFRPPILLLSGGELTVTLKGNGTGGRNQEFVLQMLKELQHIRNPFFVLSMGSDGIDGPTDAAGAWIDQHTIKKVSKYNLDIDRYLKNNDSHTFFHRLGQLIRTGPTGTNVMDFRMFFIPG